MQPYLFPYIGYWQLINAVDKFVIYDDVNFINRGWINRNRILVNGTDYMFSLPLSHAGQNKLINQIEVAENFEEWKSKFLKTLERNYHKSPFYRDVLNLLSKVLINEDGKLLSILSKSILLISEYIGIRTEFLISSELPKNDFLKGSQKIFDICRVLQADDYINPIGGIDLYKKEEFESNHIELNFLNTAKIKYDQFLDGFIPNLSIIDVMMFNAKEKTKKLLNNFELIKPNNSFFIKETANVPVGK